MESGHEKQDAPMDAELLITLAPLIMRNSAPLKKPPINKLSLTLRDEPMPSMVTIGFKLTSLLTVFPITAVAVEIVPLLTTSTLFLALINNDSVIFKAASLIRIFAELVGLD